LSGLLDATRENKGNAPIFPLPCLHAVASASSNRSRIQSVNRINSCLRVANVSISALNFMSSMSTGSFFTNYKSGLFSTAPQTRVLAEAKSSVSSFLFSCRRTPRGTLPQQLLYDGLSVDNMVTKMFDACSVYMRMFDNHSLSNISYQTSFLSKSPHPSSCTFPSGWDPSPRGYGPGMLDAAVDDAFRPIIASRLALPVESHPPVSLDQVLPVEIMKPYQDAISATSRLFRAPEETAAILANLPNPRVSGSRTEYVRTVSRLFGLSMAEWTSSPLCVNGLFAVKKDIDSDRLICDARWANAFFVACPSVVLPDPSLFSSIVVPKGYKLLNSL